MCCNGNNGNSELGKDIKFHDNTPQNCPEPFAQVCLCCPPPCPIPLCPCPVKPLQLPCPHNQCNDGQATDAYIDRLRNEPNSRYDNFYNNYNIDWHSDGSINQPNQNRQQQCGPPRSNGATVDGQSPCCEDYRLHRQQQQNDDCADAGCPTGFKPCKLKLQPPAGCNPCGCWTAQVQPCPPKPKKKRQNY